MEKKLSKKRAKTGKRTKAKVKSRKKSLRADARAKAFGRGLAKLRERTSMSQNKLARRVGVAPPTICNIERGMFSPSLDTLVKLRKGLRVSWDTLFKGVG